VCGHQGCTEQLTNCKVYKPREGYHFGENLYCPKHYLEYYVRDHVDVLFMSSFGDASVLVHAIHMCVDTAYHLDHCNHELCTCVTKARSAQFVQGLRSDMTLFACLLDAV